MNNELKQENLSTEILHDVKKQARKMMVICIITSIICTGIFATFIAYILK